MTVKELLMFLIDKEISLNEEVFIDSDNFHTVAPIEEAEAYGDCIVLKTENIKKYLDPTQMIVISEEELSELLYDYFRINKTCYSYNLNRDKRAFELGTMTLNDFTEFDQDNIDEIVEYIFDKVRDSNE